MERHFQEPASRLAQGTALLHFPKKDVPAREVPIALSSAREVRPATILLVDDDEDLRYITELILGMRGYGVISCSSADLASAAFRDAPSVSLLLTDMQMPQRSGIELAREVTTLRPSLPVLIVSGRRPTSEAEVEMRERRWTFLSKSVDEPTLLGTVATLLK